MKNSRLKRTLGLAALVAATNIGSFLGGRYFAPREQIRETERSFFVISSEDGELKSCGLEYYSIINKEKFEHEAVITCDLRKVILDREIPIDENLFAYLASNNRIAPEKIYVFLTEKAKLNLQEDEFYLGSFSKDVGDNKDWVVINNPEDRRMMGDASFLIKKYEQIPIQWPYMFKDMKIKPVFE